MNKLTLQRSLFFLAIFACIQLPLAAMGQPAARSNYEAINAKQFLADRKITISNPKDTPLLSLWENKNKSQIFNCRYSEHLSVYFLTEWLKPGFLVKVLCSKGSGLFLAKRDKRGIQRIPGL